MKIWNKTHHLTDTNLILNETFTEDAFFFDIETTGFSPTYTFLYLIGCAHRVGDNFIITQYFAETKEEEGAILCLSAGTLPLSDRHLLQRTWI